MIIENQNPTHQTLFNWMPKVSIVLDQECDWETMETLINV